MSCSRRGRLAHQPGDPAAAWGDPGLGLPWPAIYWACTCLVAVVGAVMMSGPVMLWRRWSKPSYAGSVSSSTLGWRLCEMSAARCQLAGSADGSVALGRPRQRTDAGDRGPRPHPRVDVSQHVRVTVARSHSSGRPDRARPCSRRRESSPGMVRSSRCRSSATSTTPPRRRGRAGRHRRVRSVRRHRLADRSVDAAAGDHDDLGRSTRRTGAGAGDPDERGERWRLLAAHGETLTTAYMSLAGLSICCRATAGKRRAPLTMGRLATWAFLHVGINDPTVHELITLGSPTSGRWKSGCWPRDAKTKLHGVRGGGPEHPGLDLRDGPPGLRCVERTGDRALGVARPASVLLVRRDLGHDRSTSISTG